ncbi:hypothetical protein QWY85_17675 [Neolewinella lacunae]|uniref:Uncharacterized protein n=1 Tax=Neolewinella lacunae TaxID=1517758 RepID=A0A923PQ97_9BACT|nr:hypothetical protein [Neolewinella lacunae]MBC6995806.1 hypothetical protein [Neolewinella lacunae]MDN3636501.1 hypothetical protein [Neolewinella lacunae]
MTTVEMRQRCHDMIDQIEDERFLKVLLDLMKSIERNFGDPVIGYEADGTAVKASVAKAQFAEDLSKPEAFMTVEDFEREMETKVIA